MAQSKGKSTEAHLKKVAESLFAQYGVDAVTIRDIVKAAGLRNIASLHYYFGSKEGLVRALILDGAHAAEEWRLARLEELDQEAASLRDILKILAWPLLSVSPVRFATDTHLRFIHHLMNVNRPLYEDVIKGRWNRGYQKCMDLMRDRIDLPHRILNERFIFITIYLFSVFAAREAEIERHPVNNIWNQSHMIENLLDTVEAMLTTRPSINTDSEGGGDATPSEAAEGGLRPSA